MQYSVASVVHPNDPKQEWKFGLIFEDGTILRFFSGEAPEESEIVGLSMSDIRETEEETVITFIHRTTKDNVDRMMQAEIPQGKYSIVDGEHEWFPPDEGNVLVVPPDPGDERAQEALSGDDTPQTGTDPS